MTLEGALAGMIVGAVVVIGWKTFSQALGFTKLFRALSVHLSASS
ncbi:hypothetical protein AB3538_16465 [Acinetobacter baumannii]